MKTENGDTVVVTTTRPGELVVCNLASAFTRQYSCGGRRLPAQSLWQAVVRALDNVIDLNFYPLPYAKITNRRYRSIGLGVSGYHHMLAKRGIKWESEEHLAFADDVFGRINHAAIAASTALAAEKGSYAFFEGSDWQTGAYFEKRGYTSAAWKELSCNGGAPGHAQCISACSGTHLQHQHPGWHHRRAGPCDEALFPGGKKRQHAAPRCTRACP